MSGIKDHLDDLYLAALKTTNDFMDTFTANLRNIAQSLDGMQQFNRDHQHLVGREHEPPPHQLPADAHGTAPVQAHSHHAHEASQPIPGCGEPDSDEDFERRLAERRAAAASAALNGRRSNGVSR